MLFAVHGLGLLDTPKTSHSSEKQRSSNYAIHNNLSISAHCIVYTGGIISCHHHL